MAPRISVIVPAYNLARYLPAALASAFAQDLPSHEVEIIVVDDGSTDETPQVLAAYGERIRVVRQPNRGLVGAVDRGIAEARGEHIALLDADDEWPPDRLSRHLAVLDAEPAVGLIYSDMEVIGPSGETLHPSFFAWRGEQPSAGRVLGRLLAGNFISGGASTFRSDLRPAFHPIAPDAAYPDWWLAACIAAVAEIRYDPGIGNRYRFHGANMGLGADSAQQLWIQRREIPWRRWMLSHLIDDDAVAPQTLPEIYGGWRFALLAAASIEPGGAAALLEPDPAGAAAVLAAPGHDGPAALSRRLLRALAHNPFDGAAAIDLEVALGREAALPAAPPSPPLAAVALGEDPTVAWIEELLAVPELIGAFAAEVSAGRPSTLLVLTPPSGDVGALAGLVENDPRISGDACDIAVLARPRTTPAAMLLAARASACLTLAEPPAPFDRLPRHPAAGRLPGPAAAAA